MAGLMGYQGDAITLPPEILAMLSQGATQQGLVPATPAPSGLVSAPTSMGGIVDGGPPAPTVPDASTASVPAAAQVAAPTPASQPQAQPATAPSGNPFMDAVKGAGSFFTGLLKLPGDYVNATGAQLEAAPQNIQLELAGRAMALRQAAATWQQIQALPPSERLTAMLNGPEYAKEAATRYAAANITAGDSRYLPPVAGAPEQTIVAPKLVLDDKSGLYGPQDLSGFHAQGQLPGGYTVKDGLVVNDRGGITGAYSTPEKLAPGETPGSFTPTYTPGQGVPAIPQTGGGASAGSPGISAPAPASGLDANGDAVPVVSAEEADKLPLATVSFQAPVQGRISSGFGPRSRPMPGATANHRGIDYAVPTGTPVSAAADGTVLAAGPVNGFGNAVVLRHADGSSSLYGHLSKVAVQPGQTVQQGANLGASGATGVATGPNLHFAIYNSQNQPVNPQKLLAGGSMPTGAQQAQAPTSRPIPQTGGGTAQGPAGWTIGTPPGGRGQRYQIVDGSQVQGGKPGERYKIDTLGAEAPALQTGGFDPSMVSQRGQEFMGSEDYKNAANTASAVNGLIRTMKTVGPSTPMSWATLDSALRAFNPGMGVRQSSIQAFMEEMGWPAEVQGQIMKLQGKGFVPPEVQHQLLNAAYAYADSHNSVLQQRHAANVKWAQGHGFSEGDLGESLPTLAPFPTNGPVPAQERVVGRTYETPKGILTWTGKGWSQ